MYSQPARTGHRTRAEFTPYVLRVRGKAMAMALIIGVPTTTPYSTTFASRSAVLTDWTPQESCAHCSNAEADGSHKDECTNMTLSATTFGSNGMTHTTQALGSSIATSCRTTQQVCSSGHLTWNPVLKFGNISVVARWFPGSQGTVQTATGFIGLDAPGNEASITMGFHGVGWLGGHGEGPHRYQHGIYADVRKSHNRMYTDVAADISAGFHQYGLLWTPSLVEWFFDGASVRKVTNASIIPQIGMQLRLHTRSGYCGHMAPNTSFQATFQSFSYEPVAHGVQELASE